MNLAHPSEIFSAEIFSAEIFPKIFPEVFLGYCTNVHPALSAEDVISQIRSDCAEVKKQIPPKIRFGVGLWLSSDRLREFQGSPRLIRHLQEACLDKEIPIFSWNAFPQQDFHQMEVKDKVYFPDWSDPSRLQYTLDIMELIVQLNSSPREVSISTLPLGAIHANWEAHEIQTAISHLIQFVIASDRIRNQSGVSIHLDLEPEPFCILESSQDVVQFFKEHLLVQGAAELESKLGISREKAEALILDQIRICYDTCHAAVLYESPEEVLRNYDRLGIKIGKVQLSSGLVYKANSGSLTGSSLLELSSDRYLHQVMTRRRSTSYIDLKDAILDWKQGKPMEKEYRIHYHLPIFMERFGELETTQDHIRKLLAVANVREITRHWEVETYTWSLISDQTGNGDLSERIAREICWASELFRGADTHA